MLADGVYVCAAHRTDLARPQPRALAVAVLDLLKWLSQQLVAAERAGPPTAPIRDERERAIAWRRALAVR